MDNLSSKLKRLRHQEDVEGWVKYMLFCAYVLLPPMFLYFFIQWDPIILDDAGEQVPIAALLLTVIWWTVIFLIHKYRERSRDRAWQLAQFLSSKWTMEQREVERIKLTSDLRFMHELKQEYPEIFEDELLKLP